MFLVSSGERNWPFLTPIGAAGLRRGGDHVRLSAEEGRDLEDVEDLGGRRGLRGLVNVGEERQAGLALHFIEDPQPLVEAGAAEGCDRGAVRLVEGGFEDELDPELVAEREEALGHHRARARATRSRRGRR